MSVSVSRNFNLSSTLGAEEEAPKAIEKQGIVSILGSGCEGAKAASLRRTLSADMSSRKWLAQNGFSSPMKKIASHEELASSAADSSSASEPEEDYEPTKTELDRPSQSEVWMSIQSEKRDRELERPGQFDTWISIISQKAEDPSKLPPPYIHPLVKRSASSLSGKSLEICTESLGSETGSDGFSLYAPSETSDVEEDKEEVKQQQQQEEEEEEEEEKDLQSFDTEEFQIPKYNLCYKKSSLRSIPPPLPSRTLGEGPSVQMHSYRENGRLVLEAVSVLPQNSLHAQRQDGRLLLTLVSNPQEVESSHEEMEEGKVEEFKQVFDNSEKEEERGKVEEEEEEEDQIVEEREEGEEMNLKFEKENKDKEMGFVMEQEPKLTSGVINVHRSALMMKKLMSLDNRNATWPHKFNKAVSLVELEAEEEEELRQSLSAPPRVARLIRSPSPSPSPSPPPPPPAAAAFNGYEYFWRTKPVVASIINPIITQQSTTLKNNCNKAILPNSKNMYEQQELVLMRGNKGDYLVPLLRGCKEPRRSLWIWEPYCIATS